MAQPASTDDRPPIYAACLDIEGARALVSKLYGWSVDHIKRLPGYDDLNFYIKSSDAAASPKNNEFVLKIVNSRESINLELMSAHTSLLLHLVSHGITCPTPVKNAKGDYYSLEEIVDKTGKQPEGLKFLVRMMVYVPGKLVRDLYKPGALVPDKCFYVMGQSLATINKALLDFRSPAIEVLKKQAQEFVWSPNCFPKVRQVLWAVKDEEKRKLAEAVLEEFETTVVPKMAELRQCVLHTDFNDMNIIRLSDAPTPWDTDWHTAGGLDIPAGRDSGLGELGAIDFSDTVYSNLVFDPSNSQAYMMMSQGHGDPLVSGGHFLAGYNSVLPLTSTEMSLVKYCTSARLVHSMVNGLHAYTLDPNNGYVLDTQRTGWHILEQLWSKPNADLMAIWGRIAQLYRLSSKGSSLLSDSNQEESDPGPSYKCIIHKPFLSVTDAKELLRKLYSVEAQDVEQIKELLSYDDQNFYVRVGGGALQERNGGEEFVLKVINSKDSADRGTFEMQVSVLQFLEARGFCCPRPVPNAKDEYLSLEKMYRWAEGPRDCEGAEQQYGLFLVFMLTFIPGRTMSTIKPVPEQLFFDAGVKLARMDKLLWDYPDISNNFRSRAENFEWSLECCPWMYDHLAMVSDENRRELVKSIIKTYEDKVAPKISRLRKCLIHNDYNNYNIIVLEESSSAMSVGDDVCVSNPSPAKKTKHCPQYDISGIIDFSDMLYSCLVFEVGNALASMLYANDDDPLAAAGHLLAGFHSVIPLTAEERGLLYVCMIAHTAQELVLSLHSHHLQPDNEYILLTQGRGWELLKELWGDAGARTRAEKLWRDISESHSK